MFSYSKANRLVTRSDYRSVFARGKKITSKQFLLLVLPHPHNEVSRLGIIIAKKHCKQAVNRHLIRRIAKESFRHALQTLKAVDIIVIMRSPWCLSNGKIDKSLLRKEFDSLWSKLIT